MRIILDITNESIFKLVNEAEELQNFIDMYTEDLDKAKLPQYLKQFDNAVAHAISIIWEEI